MGMSLYSRKVKYTCDYCIMVTWLYYVVDYVDKLLEEVLQLCSVKRSQRVLPLRRRPLPSLAAQFHHPCKEDAVRDHESRFNDV